LLSPTGRPGSHSRLNKLHLLLIGETIVAIIFENEPRGYGHHAVHQLKHGIPMVLIQFRHRKCNCKCTVHMFLYIATISHNRARLSWNLSGKNITVNNILSYEHCS